MSRATKWLITFPDENSLELFLKDQTIPKYTVIDPSMQDV